MMFTPNKSLCFVALLSIGTVAASESSTGFSFSTPTDIAAHANAKTTLRRRRTSGKEIVTPKARALAKDPKSDGTLSKEDNAFWERALTDDFSLPSTVPPTTPETCPVRIEVDCVLLDGTVCTDVQPPASGTGDECIVEAEYTYTITNDGDEPERLYYVVVTRDGLTTVVTDLPDAIPITDLAPGQSITVTSVVELNICEGGASVFDTEATVTAGPPCDVEVSIACDSEEGDECKDIPQAPSPDDCMLDITYTYTVENTGSIDANIVIFVRERDGDTQDLMGLLDSTFLPEGGTTFVEESEEIDRCVAQSFSTKVRVVQLPNSELLCKDTGFYP